MRKRRWGGKTDYDMAIYGYCAIASILSFTFSAGAWFLIKMIVGYLYGRTR